MLLVFFLSGGFRHGLLLCDVLLDLSDKGPLHVRDQTRVRHLLLIHLEAELGSRVHILRLSVEVFVLSHQYHAFCSKLTTVFLEEAAELDKI